MHDMKKWQILVGLLWLLASPVAVAQNCGSEGQRACNIFERVPSCFPYLVESGGRCVHPPCGREGESACTVLQRMPSCDINLAEVSGRCVLPTPCGHLGERACRVWEHVPSCKSTDLVEAGGQCTHPPCGQEGKAACTVAQRLPSCDTGLIEQAGRCVLPTPCGREGQRECRVWENVPSCRSPDLVASGGACVHPACGRDGGAACAIAIRIPNCDSGLVERNGHCGPPTPCGEAGQRECRVWENIPSCKRPELVAGGGLCTHPPCGRKGELACLVTQRIPSCDGGLIEVNGSCQEPGPCGQEGQPACGAFSGKPACGANLLNRAGTCIHPPCGRVDERACLVGERIPSCDANLLENRGMCRGVNCGHAGTRACAVSERVPSCDRGTLEISGVCIHRPDCGAAGQRACTLTERRVGQGACNLGMTEVSGCNGECFGSSSRCADFRRPMLEPEVNVTPLPASDPMRGFADLHVHMFSHLAMGGGVLTGKPYDPVGGVNKALMPDYATTLDLVSFLGTNLPTVRCPTEVPNCGKVVLHGDHIGIVDDTAGMGTGDSTKSHFGAPVFNGWPTWKSTVHQQVYYKWLERAWRGGLRLMVMLAVNNEVLCRTSKRLRTADCSNSMAGIDEQLSAARAFADWHKRQPGGGWFEIVVTPDEAERAVRKGHLAVVLGVEADSVFNCKAKVPCDKGTLRRKIAEYRGKGVRHIYPTHDFDNGLAGTAVWMDFLNIGNRIIENQWYEVESCAQTDFKLAKGPLMTGLGLTVTAVYNAVQQNNNLPYPVYPGVPGCNVRGLSSNGVSFIHELMNAGMMIDIDHMSYKAVDDTLKIALSRYGYPVSVGHGLFSEVYKKFGQRHERMRTEQELMLIKQSGGIVSVMTSDELKSGSEFRRADGSTFVNDCLHSSKSFVHNYLYAIGQMGGAAVAFGSDFNGLAQHVGPRFGEDGCDRDPHQWSAQQMTRRLQYPFTLDGFGVFERQVTGQRVFDFNIDGLAHIGLYPDLIADMLEVGVRKEELEPLFNSAKAYIETWRRAELMSRPPVR